MLSTEQRKSRLEDLLERVRKNKDRSGSAQAVATPVQAAAPAPKPTPQAARPEPTQPIAPLLEPPTAPEPVAARAEEDDIDFGFAESFQSNLPGAVAPMEAPPTQPEQPVAVQPEPEPVAPVAPAVVASRTFESAPEASGPVVGVIGDRAEDWTIAAVLQRAWQFGAK